MGWIKVDRKLFDHWIWDDKPFSKGQAWIDLIGLANYRDEKTIYMGEVITCKRGTVYRSISFLARRWGWSRDKTTRFLRALESDSMLRIKTTTNRTTITIENYGKFQNAPATNNATDKATDKATSRQRADRERRSIKNIKENKEEYRPSDSPEDEGNPWPDDVWED